MDNSTMETEFGQQLQTLLDKGYPALAGMTAIEFAALVAPLRGKLPKEASDGSIPFVIVVRSKLVPTVAAVERFMVGSRSGFTDMQDEIDRYQPIDGVDVPLEDVYLLVDIETGADTLNIRPNDALPIIRDRNRTPLTTDEGVALVTHFPKIFEEHNAFQALGSRTDNKRIPSFWVSKGAPRLGWCWAGNPHTWLGAGSARERRSLTSSTAAQTSPQARTNR